MSLQGKKQVQRHTTMYVAQNTSGQYVAQNTGNQQKQQAVPQKQNNQQQGVRTYTGNNKGYGNKKYNKNKPIHCITCNPIRHEKYSDCPYNTPEKRRKRLVELEICQACGVRKKEHGTECSHRARCFVHPGESHYHFLCDGEKSTHPGPQQDFTMVSKNKYSLQGAVSKSQK